MSGVFALLDPKGVDEAAALRAMASVTYRGEPSLVAAGSVAVGTYVGKGHETSGVRRTGGHLISMDARIDANVPGTRASSSARFDRGPELLEDVFLRFGPEELIGVAGEFSLVAADPEAERITVARDAFGTRSLFWARKGPVSAVASDVEVLIALGLATGALDDEVVSAFLCLRHLEGEAASRTAFEGVRVVLAGRWMEFDVTHDPVERLWFEPERLCPPALDDRSGVAAVRESVLETTDDRARGKNVGLFLSGGRDSASIAVALRDVGVKAVCMTYDFDPGVQESEVGVARTLAEDLGHDWMPIRCSSATVEDLAQLRLVGTPMESASWPLMMEAQRVAQRAGLEVLLTGEGGEPLFQASPLGLLDLLGRGRVVAACRASHNFARRWKYPYSMQAKRVGWNFVPRRLLVMREEWRPLPPWVARPPAGAGEPPRRHWAERARLADMLTTPSFASFWGDRLSRFHGHEDSAPMLDLRVLRVALGLPLELRMPVDEPKPSLMRAFLGGTDFEPVKMVFRPYFDYVSRSLLDTFPELIGGGGKVEELGLVRPDALGDVREPRWAIEAANLAFLEAWLRGGAGRR